jgi:hypothetical protein
MLHLPNDPHVNNYAMGTTNTQTRGLCTRNIASSEPDNPHGYESDYNDDEQTYFYCSYRFPSAHLMNAEEAHKAATNIRHYFVDIRSLLLTYEFAIAWWLQLSFFDARSSDQ